MAYRSSITRRTLPTSRTKNRSSEEPFFFNSDNWFGGIRVITSLCIRFVQMTDEWYQNIDHFVLAGWLAPCNLQFAAPLTNSKHKPTSGVHTVQYRVTTYESVALFHPRNLDSSPTLEAVLARGTLFGIGGNSASVHSGLPYDMALLIC